MFFDCHVHSLHSHDGKDSVAALASSAKTAGLAGIAVTDHCDCEYAEEDRVYERIAASFRDAAQEALRFGPDLGICKGVELGDALYDPLFAERIVSSFAFDVILCSVHAVRFPGAEEPFSRIDFSGWSGNALDAYLSRYYDELAETLDRFDHDVVSHLTVPLRYICHKYGRHVENGRYREKIDAVLRLVVEKGKTLEVNTQGLVPGGAGLCPEEAVLDRYLALGGRDLSLGSDAHFAGAVGQGFHAAARLLREKGVTDLVFFLGRKKQRAPIPE